MKRLLRNEPGVGSRSIWGHRDLRLAVSGRAIGVAGDGMVMVVLVLRTHDAGHGAAAITGLMVSFAVPVVALMGLGGLVADSRDSRQILMVSGIVQALACVGLASSDELAATYALVVVLQVGQAFSSPVWSALVPRIVGDENIGRAIALQQGIGAATAPAGAALGGVLFGLYGAQAACWCSAGAFAVLVVAARLVRTRRNSTAERAGRVEAVEAAAARAGARLTAGLRILQHDTVTWALFCALMPLIVVVEGVNVVEVFLVRDELHASPVQYGLSEVAFSGGAVAGSVLVGRLVSDLARMRAVLWALGATCLLIVASGLSPAFWFYLICGTAIGGTNTLANASLGALAMTRTPDADRGKVASAMNGMSRLFSITALLFGGMVGTLLGPRLTFIVAGAAGAVVVASAALLLHRNKRRPSRQPAAGPHGTF